MSLYSINLLVFITETDCVYCAVRSESLNVKQVKFGLLRVNLPHMFIGKFYHWQIKKSNLRIRFVCSISQFFCYMHVVRLLVQLNVSCFQVLNIDFLFVIYC